MKKKKMLACVCAVAMIAGMFTPWSNVEVQAARETEPNAVTQNASKMRETLNFNNDWGFFRGDLEGAQAEAFDDGGFVDVTIPHTMRLEKKHNNTTNGVYKGIGWYRKYFTLDESYQQKKLQLKFEGVMTDSDIYLNGEKIYTRNGGYVGFTIDITDKVKFGEENVLAVRVSNADNADTPPGKPDSRLDFHYYGGIYRDVELEVSEKTYVTDELAAGEVAGGGIFVTYSDVSEESADVHVKTHVQNDNEDAKNVYTKQILKDANDNIVAEVTSEEETIASGEGTHFEQEIVVEDPTLWDVDEPYLYELVTEIYENDAKVDEVTTKAGIRTIAYKSDGFYLNGERVYLRGANRHQSYQNVGDAAPNSMQYRDAVIMKENGFNAVRATHYPQDPAFLDACDEIGLLVIECQPGWQNFTNTDVFYQRTLRDTREMIRRDRNRPSVVLWETSLNETAYSKQWAEEATTAAHEEYPGDQLFTASDYGYHGNLYDVCYKVQDTQWSDNPADWKDFDPKKPFFTREWGDFEGSSKALRKDGEAALNTQIYTRQRYLNGNGYSDWGGLDASDRIGGYFLWSWNDYSRGSTTQSLGSGTVDMDRYEKNCYYWVQSMQPADNPVYGPMVYISCDYTESSSLTVPVFSNCDSVKLYQNGALIQEITREEAGVNVPNIMKKGGSPIFEFQLSEFEAGTLKAEGIVDGEVVTEYEVATPGEAAGFEIEIRDRGITPVADGSDLIPVHVKAVDANGTIVPDYKGIVHLEVSGNGKLVGDNIPRIQVEDQKLEKGIGYAFVRTTDIVGDVTITASCEGMEDGSKTITTKASTDKFVPAGSDKGWADSEEIFEEPVLENIALGRPVTVSTEQNGNYADHIVDGDEGTRWCASNGSLPQWVMVDLGQASAIAGFQLMWENASSVYKYIIEVSDDALNWDIALDMSGNTKVNTATETQMVKTAGRYVRLNITGISDGWASLFEFCVIPDRDAEPVAPGEEIPDEMIASIIASEGFVEGRGPELVRDGETNIGTGWLSPNAKKFPQTLEVKFKEPQTLLGSAIWWEKDSTKITYDIEVSKDGETWETVMANLEETWHDEEPETFTDIPENVTAIRVVLKDKTPADADLGMAEWKIYGYTYEEPQPEPEKPFEYASDLEWESAHSDFGSVTKDVAVYGGNLVLNTEEGTKTFERGLSADTNSEIVYDIEGQKFYKFESYIGINKNAGKQGGEAIFKVYADNALLYTSPVKMRDDNCEFISIDLPEGTKKVKLEAIWSGNTENPEARYNTHVDWADAKFLRKIVTEKVDKEDLKTLIDYAKEAKKTESYKYLVPKVKALFDKAFDAAVAADANENATQAEVDAAYDELLAKVHLLSYSGNAASLRQLVELADGKEEKLYTKGSWTPFAKARDAAHEVLKDENALQAEIDAAYQALDAAMKALVVNPIDTEKLENLIKKASVYEENIGKYTASSAQLFTAALSDARDILASEDFTQEAIDGAYKSLLGAIFGLREIPNKDKLDELIGKVKAMDLSVYSEKTANAVKAAYAYAVSVFEDENADQNRVDVAAAVLEDAVKAANAEVGASDETGHKVASDNAGNKTTNKTSGKTAGNTAAKTGDGANAAVPAAVGLGAVLVAVIAWKKKVN